MALISNITEVQKLGLRVVSIDRSGWMPNIARAERKHLLPALGADVMTELEKQYTKQHDVAKWANLLPKVQLVVAAFAYHDDLPMMHAQLTDGGVRRTTTDNMPAAFRWEYEEVKASLQETALTELETLLQYLEENSDEYTEWTGSEAYQLRNELLLKSGAELKRYYHVHQPYRTYAALMPTAMNVETMYLAPLMPEDFLQSFRDMTGATNAEPEEKQALELMKAATAYLTIAEASKRFACTITANGWMVRQEAGSGNSDGRGRDGMLAASTELVRKVGDDALITGKKYLAQLRNLLNEKASETLFADYYSSSYYQAGNPRIVDRKNDQRKIFRL